MGTERFTVINIVEKSVEVQSFDPVTKMGIRLRLPEELELETVGGRGRWRVGVLGELADRFGKQWAADSVAAFLGIGYVGSSGSMGLWDSWQLWMWQRQVKWKDVDLGKSVWVREVVDVDDQKVLEVSPGLRSKIGDWFLASNIANEQFLVTVVNTTGVAGLGSRVARVLESAGMRVVAVSNSDSEVGKCEVSGQKKSFDTVSVKWIINTFGCVWHERAELGEADLTVAMGRDYRNWWLGK
jgi:hypothetical protein